MKAAYIGLDVGTSGCKAAAVGGGKIGLFQSLDKNNILEIYKNAL